MRIKSLGLLAASLLLMTVPVAQAADGNPLEKTNGFYVDPDSNPAVWVSEHPNDKPRVDMIRSAISTKAGARWFGNWSGDVRAAVDSFTWAADVVDKLPILVAYNIPGRDCGGHSSGGAGSPDAYKAWISQFADGIGGKPAIVIIEPDAVAQLACLPLKEQQTRLDLLRYAADQFAQKAPNTWAYLDGGNATWIAADIMAERLNAAGVSAIRGFALNVSNFHTTAASTAYGNEVNANLSRKFSYTKPFVVDTSRNGNGSDGEWCNPSGRKLGTPSQVGGGAEMLLWVKVPGDSDGDCGAIRGIPAGTFSPDLAMGLIEGK
ncbi:glycoside hydrolase family 6 protein [Kibdelosporangium persicum]|nr:glycoside hydrolase family 6 protein [Kibdelosporangium persicum]